MAIGLQSLLASQWLLAASSLCFAMGWDHTDPWSNGSWQGTWEWIPSEDSSGTDWQGRTDRGWQGDNEGRKGVGSGKGKGNKGAEVRHEPYKGDKGGKSKGCKDRGGKSKDKFDKVKNESDSAPAKARPPLHSQSPQSPAALSPQSPPVPCAAVTVPVALSYFSRIDRTDLQKTLTKVRDTHKLMPALSSRLDTTIQKVDALAAANLSQFTAIAKDCAAARHASNRAEAQATANQADLSALSDFVTGSDAQQLHNMACIANFLWHFYKCMISALKVPDSLSDQGPPHMVPAAPMQAPPAPASSDVSHSSGEPYGGAARATSSKDANGGRGPQ